MLDLLLKSISIQKSPPSTPTLLVLKRDNIVGYSCHISPKSIIKETTNPAVATIPKSSGAKILAKTKVCMLEVLIQKCLLWFFGLNYHLSFYSM